jgi:hypothetical protein
MFDHFARMLATVGQCLLASQDPESAGFEQDFWFFHYNPTFSQYSQTVSERLCGSRLFFAKRLAFQKI